MNLLAVGISHRTAEVGTLERLAVPGHTIGKLLDELLECGNVSEALLLSTCNRIEVYAVVEAFHGGLADVTAVLARHSGAEVDQLCEHFYVHYAAAAVEHLFSVAAGLDSLVVGEAQILGQLRAAYAQADEAGTVGKTLHELAQQALRVGKQVHSDTGIDKAGASVVSEALTDADHALGGLAGRRALLVGAGSMGRLAAAHLRRAAIGSVVIANRTAENGERLAATLLAEEAAAADVLLACTGSPVRILDAGQLAGRGRGPLVVCDLGLPRDVDPAVASMPGVTLVDLDTLQRRLADAPITVDAKRAKQIVAEGVRDYLATQRSAEVTPTVTALRRRAAEVVDTELLRLDSRLPDLDDSVRAELTRTVRRVVDKLLHTPTVRVKELACTPGGAGYADALRELFELDPQAAAVVSAPRNVETEHGGGDR
ncbi:MAG: glutamyl-tRNA reductase [Kutzneria sp.]|nr:glutamyl-tRNA reductase [Kutzneria sp.]